MTGFFDSLTGSGESRSLCLSKRGLLSFCGGTASSQWSAAEQVPLGCGVPPRRKKDRLRPGGLSRSFCLFNGDDVVVHGLPAGERRYLRIGAGGSEQLRGAVGVLLRHALAGVDGDELGVLIHSHLRQFLQ